MTDWSKSPAPAIAGDPRIAPRGCKHPREGCCSKWPGKPGRQFPEGTVRLTVEQMATLQTFPPFQSERSSMTDHSRHIVLDLFAGSGVGVAVRDLGAKEFGVELMPEAIATREANGFETIYEDVWDAHLADGLAFDTLWASPPCQTFSMAGNGAGRRALNDVLQVIRDMDYVDMAKLRERAAALGDERIGLVLSPLYYAHRFRPTYIALEQVPPVLPVWNAMADELRSGGYSVWTGLLHAEQYGVPQTRKRAILMARRDGVDVAPPTPTHSKFYNRDPERLDPGVKKWVSMEEALRWGMTRRPYPTVSTGAATSGGGTDPAALGGSGARKTVYAERAAGAPRWIDKVAA